MFLNLDPAAEAQLTLHDLDILFLAQGVLAARPLVRRDLCKVG